MLNNNSTKEKPVSLQQLFLTDGLMVKKIILLMQIVITRN